MLTGNEQCSRCGHVRAVHGAPRDRRGLGCIAGGSTGCTCPAFVLYDTAIEPLVSEEELPSVLPSVEDVSLALGDRVLFRRPLVRKRSSDERVRHGYDGLPVKMLIARRDWVRGEQEMWRQGIIIGKRTLQNGEYNYGGEDGPSYLTDIEYVPAYLIAYDLPPKPVRVLEDDIKPL